MQNRSFVVLKYKSIYYTFYNHFDSYPSHLGVLIIEDIKQIINENKYEELKEAVLFTLNNIEKSKVEDEESSIKEDFVGLAGDSSRTDSNSIARLRLPYYFLNRGYWGGGIGGTPISSLMSACFKLNSISLSLVVRSID